MNCNSCGDLPAFDLQTKLMQTRIKSIKYFVPIVYGKHAGLSNLVNMAIILMVVEVLPYQRVNTIIGYDFHSSFILIHVLTVHIHSFCKTLCSTSHGFSMPDGSIIKQL